MLAALLSIPAGVAPPLPPMSAQRAKQDTFELLLRLLRMQAVGSPVADHLRGSDLGLPDIDGTEVISRLRGWSQVPIIILSARDQETEKIAALDLGADDYVEKPFSIGELTARMRTALRHRVKADGGLTEIGVDGLRIDTVRRVVERDGTALKLTPKEYDLLVLLARNAGRVVTHKTLLTSVWGPAHSEDMHYLRVFIGQLRGKIERSPADPTIIRTEPGVGYRFASAD